MKTDKQNKVVFQLSNNDNTVQKSLIRQLNNVITAMDDIAIELVTHGYGVDFLLIQAPFKAKIEALHRQGVSFLMCRNTLEQGKIDPSGLLSFCEVIPSGLAHIIRRQSEGWSYIKAGF